MGVAAMACLERSSSSSNRKIKHVSVKQTVSIGARLTPLVSGVVTFGVGPPLTAPGCRADISELNLAKNDSEKNQRRNFVISAPPSVPVVFCLVLVGLQ